MTTADEAAARIKWVSEYLDENIGKNSRGDVGEGIGLDALRLIKLMEESGEVVTNFIKFRNLNPRKSVADKWETGTEKPIIKELYDVAFTAIGAAEHFLGNSGIALEQFMEHAAGVKTRLNPYPEPHYFSPDEEFHRLNPPCTVTGDLWDGECGFNEVGDEHGIWVHLDPTPWYVEEADTSLYQHEYFAETEQQFDGRYSWEAWLNDRSGNIENLAVWKPRDGYVQEKGAYRG